MRIPLLSQEGYFSRKQKGGGSFHFVKPVNP